MNHKVLAEIERRIKAIKEHWRITRSDEPVDFEEEKKGYWSSGQQRAWGALTELEALRDILKREILS